MPTGYQITRQDGMYYVTFQVIDWVDIFTRQCYRDIVIQSLDYCRRSKGLRINPYVIMSNHVHAIIMAQEANLSEVIRNFSRYIATQIIKQIAQGAERIGY